MQKDTHVHVVFVYTISVVVAAHFIAEQICSHFVLVLHLSSPRHRLPLYYVGYLIMGIAVILHLILEPYSAISAE